MKKTFNTDTLVKRLDELEKKLQPVLEKIDANVGRDYKNQVNRLRQAIKERAKCVDEQLSKLNKK